MFKRCNKCGQEWETRDDFVSDSSLEAIGFQVFFDNLRTGLFLFNHSCGTTIGIPAKHLMALYNGPELTGRDSDGRDCPGRCLNQNIMSPCSDKCRCAFISQIIREIQNRQA